MQSEVTPTVYYFVHTDDGCWQYLTGDQLDNERHSSFQPRFSTYEDCLVRYAQSVLGVEVVARDRLRIPRFREELDA